MSQIPTYDQNDHGRFYWVAIPSSLIFHVGLAWMLSNLPTNHTVTTPSWMEMTVVEPPTPPPEPEPVVEPPPKEEPPPPEPKPKPKPKKVDFQDIPPEPPPEIPTEPPPPTKKKVQRVQGMNANSFVKGGNTGLSVRAGTTLSTGATEQTIGIDEAKESTAISYAAATTQPRLKNRPPLTIPQSVIDAGLEGTVQIVVEIDIEGNVTEAKVTKSLSPDADEACLESWRAAKFKPALQDDQPVSVTNFPRRCRFKSMD